MFPPKLNAGSDFFGADAPSPLVCDAVEPKLPNVAKLAAPKVGVLLLPVLPKVGGAPNEDGAVDTLPKRFCVVCVAGEALELLAPNIVLGLTAEPLAAVLPKVAFATEAVPLLPKFPNIEPLAPVVDEAAAEAKPPNTGLVGSFVFCVPELIADDPKANPLFGQPVADATMLPLVVVLLDVPCVVTFDVDEPKTKGVIGARIAPSVVLLLEVPLPELPKIIVAEAMGLDSPLMVDATFWLIEPKRFAEEATVDDGVDVAEVVVVLADKLFSPNVPKTFLVAVDNIEFAVLGVDVIADETPEMVVGELKLPKIGFVAEEAVAEPVAPPPKLKPTVGFEKAERVVVTVDVDAIEDGVDASANGVEEILLLPKLNIGLTVAVDIDVVFVADD